MRFAKSKLLNTATFRLALQNGEAPLPLFKSAIKDALGQLRLAQAEGVSSAELVKRYTWLIDQLVIFAWQNFAAIKPDALDMELVAVGGYGRGELHPHSDVDLLILLQKEQYDSAQPGRSAAHRCRDFDPDGRWCGRHSGLPVARDS